MTVLYRQYEKHPNFQTVLHNVMPPLDNSSRDRVVGMLELGASQADIAQRFGVSRMTISRLWRRFQTTNSTADRPRSGRPRVTTPRQDHMIRLRHLRNRTENPANTAVGIPGLRRISRRTVQRRLFAAGLRARRPYKGPMLTARHCREQL